MGCGSSAIADTRSHVSVTSKRSRSDIQSTGTEEQIEPDTGLLVSKWIPGFAMDENENGATIQTYEDYRGFSVTNANTASRTKTEKVCRWADEALEARAQHGNTFFNPNNPAYWPRDVLATYDSAALLASAQSNGKSPGKTSDIRSESRSEHRTGTAQVTLSSRAAVREAA